MHLKKENLVAITMLLALQLIAGKAVANNSPVKGKLRFTISSPVKFKTMDKLLEYKKIEAFEGKAAAKAFYESYQKNALLVDAEGSSIQFSNASNTMFAEIGGFLETATSTATVTNGYLSFKTKQNNAFTEKMSLSSSGLLTATGFKISGTLDDAEPEDKILAIDGSGNFKKRSAASLAQNTSLQILPTEWGHYVKTALPAKGNTIIQIQFGGKNSFWNGVFSVNSQNSYTPYPSWNNVKLISYCGYNANADDVEVQIMSNYDKNDFKQTFIVIKTTVPYNIANNIGYYLTGPVSVTVSVLGPNAPSLSLSDHQGNTAPYTYLMATSAGSLNNNSFGESYGSIRKLDGNISIGQNNTTDTSFNLFVEKGILTRKVTVNPNKWADYVFNTDYKLRSIQDVEAFINKNKHLPDVPTTETVAKEGLNVGDNQAVLLKKIEELTLYIIELNKRIQTLEKNNKN